MPLARRVLMPAAGFEHGGQIASVLEAYYAHGLLRRWPVKRFIAGRAGGGLGDIAATIRTAVELVLELMRGQAAVLHLHASPEADLWRNGLFAGVALAARCPLVVQLHGEFVRFYESQCGGWRRRAIHFVLERCACVIVSSERERRWLCSVTPYPRAACVPYPVPDTPLVPAPGRRSMILFCGSLELHSGVGDLVKAVSGLRLQMPEVTLVCTGEGDPEPLRRLCEQLGVADAVIALGPLDNENRRTLMQRAAAFVLAAEGGARLGALEAMAARVPVVAAGFGRVHDWFTDNVDALLFQPGDVPSLHRLLARLLHDPALASRLAAEARRTVAASHSIDRVLAQLGSIYTALGVERAAEAECDVRLRTRSPA